MMKTVQCTQKMIRKLFDSLKERYQSNLESMKASEFALDYIPLLYYKHHKTIPNRGGLYTD